MGEKKHKRLPFDHAKDDEQDDARRKINAILDEIIHTVSKSPQLDSFFEKKIAEIKVAGEDSFSHISRRFVKAPAREKEILLQLLKYWTGIEHIKFLQEFLKREPFWPSIGMLMLDLFNKRDAMLEDGLASRLLDLDSLSRRLKQYLVTKDSLDSKEAESIVQEFLQRDEKEQEGILSQLIDETGIAVTPLLVKAIEKDERLGQKILEWIGNCYTEDSFKILDSIYQSTRNKDILKIMKRCMHSLKQKGITVFPPETEDHSEAVFKKITLPEPRAFISSIDGIGDRIIFMVKALTTHEYKLFQIFISDVGGVKEIMPLTLFRKDAERFIEKLLTDEQVKLLETTPEHAGYVVEEAYAINQALGNVAAGSIEQWRNIFTDILQVRRQPIIYDYLDAEKIRSQSFLQNRFNELFERLEIIYWFIAGEEAKEQWRKFKQAAATPLILSPYQKEERSNELYKETATLFFTPQQLRLFQRRLEELAYFMYKEGSEEKAGVALHAALLLASPEIPPARNVFCLSLVKEGLAFFESGGTGKPERDRLIVDPQDVSLIV